ncbi:MAG: hypothetical protein E4H36_05750 [Spirochaetales bacterium]|nr:MAG: hypothetical protein E4H36_05750 [Spirochaetales bacterium]
MIAIAVTGAVIVAALLLLFLLRKKEPAGSGNPPPSRTGQPETKPCPLCGSQLVKTERVHSALFPGREDKLMHIFGCPYCYPANRERERRCPACRKTLADDGYLIARVFEKPGKTHVHVLGCTGCRHG